MSRRRDKARRKRKHDRRNKPVGPDVVEAPVPVTRKHYVVVARGLISDFKKQGCLCCPEKDESCLDAHHRDKEEKKFTIGKAVCMRLPLDLLAVELAKCCCLCANCHRKFHAGRFALPEQGLNSDAEVHP